MADSRHERSDSEPQFNLLGKDWLTVIEAAHYCGVHPDTFAKRANEYGLHPRNFMGKKLYEKAELYRAIYQSPLWHGSSSVGGALPPMSMERLGPRTGMSQSVEEALKRLRQPVSRAPRRKLKAT
ncbi:hypothetical protein FHW84_003778 [Dyella sp. SG562]|jgi:hypothetical protein|uniref:helix-turn-helix domain-containing protein n=1 Tax=Dyella sp. SG562 TaxID=2587017 RepID=UPI001423E7A6|nr:helix-turn-helix domain-containing protein [Dyella sp. SG562]NII75180.1 hypothetical protein [Dyella sp. SG562]